MQQERLSLAPRERGGSTEAAELRLERATDLASVRADWTRLADQAGNVFGSWEWADSWCRHLAGEAPLALAVARRPSGEAAAIMPLWVARSRPLRVLRFIGAGPSDELGPVCAPSDRALAAIALRRHVAETLDGSGVFIGERLWGESRMPSQLGALTVLRTASPVLRTDGRTFDEFLASRSRNFRSVVRRRERRLARGFKLVYRLTEEPDRLESDMQTLIRLHQARWGSAGSSVFKHAAAAFHLDFARRALERGWLRLWTMELDGRPAAVWYGLRQGDVESYYQAGRDPALRGQGVGFVLLCHSIRCAFEDGMREYRFGSGGESYKRRFAEYDPGLDTVVIAAGVRGRAALGAIRMGTLAPKPLQRIAWQAGAQGG